jgi:hypothetical protein
VRESIEEVWLQLKEEIEGLESSIDAWKRQLEEMTSARDNLLKHLQETPERACPSPGGCEACPKPHVCVIGRVKAGLSTLDQEKAWLVSRGEWGVFDVEIVGSSSPMPDYRAAGENQ